MYARIYQPTKSAMQSGVKKNKAWILEYSKEEARCLDPLMGWTSSGETLSQVRLQFETRGAAEAYASANGIKFIIITPKARCPNIRQGGYGENFATDRKEVWTH